LCASTIFSGKPVSEMPFKIWGRPGDAAVRKFVRTGPIPAQSVKCPSSGLTMSFAKRSQRTQIRPIMPIRPFAAITAQASGQVSDRMDWLGGKPNRDFRPVSTRSNFWMSAKRSALRKLRPRCNDQRLALPTRLASDTVDKGLSSPGDN